jgi:hypothetical protein
MYLKPLAQPRADRCVVDRATNLEAVPFRDQRVCYDLFMSRLTGKFAVPSVIDAPTRRSARYRLGQLVSQLLWPLR